MAIDASFECKSTKRSLFRWEVNEARRVFGDTLRYERIRIHECVTWTNMIYRLHGWLINRPTPKSGVSMTIGFHCFFPLQLLDQLVPISHPEQYKISLLIHELAHCWQYQFRGWTYLWLAIAAQSYEEDSAYEFGGEHGLVQRYQQGWRLKDFNVEQQADIARSYYERLCQGKDVSAWLPFIGDFQKTV